MQVHFEKLETAKNDVFRLLAEAVDLGILHT